MIEADVIVIGAGVSGAALAFFASARARLLLLEAEDAPGRHSTGRSAALYTPNIGPAAIRALDAASGEFFLAPPPGFAEAPLLTQRGAVSVMRPGEEARLAAALALSSPAHPIHRVEASEAMALAPLLRRELVGAAAFEPGVADMDVAAIHQGFLAGAKRAGARLICNARVERLERRGGRWHARAGALEAAAPIVVNAAGAWGDAVATLAGATPVGLTPKRRTGLIVEAPAGASIARGPLVEMLGEDAYLKPDEGRLMLSPGDQTPVPPHDVLPEEWDVAVALDWLSRVTTLDVRRAPRAWAGLRSFVADGLPVVGFDPVCEGFFWLVGQGGYGIMLSPSLGRASAALIAGESLPADLVARGVAANALAPGRSGLRGSDAG
jgi:D-arginine dehydrogenase